MLQQRPRTLAAAFLLCNQAALLDLLFMSVHTRSLPLPTRGGKMGFRYRPRSGLSTILASAFGEFGRLT
jgi:hypothetical protein